MSVNITDILNQIKLPNNGLMHASKSTISNIQNLLYPIITNEKVVHFILSIRQQNLRESLCFDFFLKHDLKNDTQFPKNLYLRVLASILASPDANELYENVFDKIDHLFDESDDPDIKAEATDIMLNYFPKRGERLLNILREDPAHRHGPIGSITNHVYYDAAHYEEHEQGDVLLTRIRDTVTDLKPIQKIIYDDRENVHNASINSSIISTCRYIMQLMTSSVTFDDKYKIIVFNEDNFETVKIKLLNVLNSVSSSNNSTIIKLDQLKIYGDNENEQLQSRMRFKIINRDENKCLESFSRFDRSDKPLYMNVMYCNDYLFPEHINRNRNLEEIFIATNTWLHFINESNIDELPLYLSLTNIEDADIIWINRDQIKRELQIIVDCPDIENFVDKVKNYLFPYDNSKTDIFDKIKVGTLMDMDLHEILNAVWKFIQQHEHKIEMLKRLREELDDSAGICCSGLAARLINSIQGFFDEIKHPSLKIKINIDDEMKSKINRLVSQTAITQQIDPLYDSDKFKLLVMEIVETHSDSIINEFTSEDIIKNGINRENILHLAFEMYQLKF